MVTIQQRIHDEIQSSYEEFDELTAAILAQGWMPIDAILVWKHHGNSGHYIVVEGNTRKTALRQIRDDLKKLQGEIAKLEHREADKDIIDAKKLELQQHQCVVDATEKLTVIPVKAKNVKELEEILPRILGVRHIKHPRQWGPYPQNLFILREYEKRYKAKHGTAPIALDDDLTSARGKRELQAWPDLNTDDRRLSMRVRRGRVFGGAVRHLARPYGRVLVPTAEICQTCRNVPTSVPK
jgi:hypothetical protein